jgi:uncharacterized protein DUF6600
MMRRLFLPLGLFLLCLAGWSPARAADPPPLRVGRVAAVEGGAMLQPVAGEWTDSAINDPVVAGMSARTGARSRVLLQIGAVAIALSAGTELEIVALAADNTQFVLRRGRVAVLSVPGGPARNLEVDMPRGGVWLPTPGLYDIAAGDEHVPPRVAVFDGSARLAGGGFDATVTAGTAVELNGARPASAPLANPADDDFIAWSRRQVDSAPDLAALHYVSPDATGYDRLDASGAWEAADGHGMAWFPRDLPPDWAPYRDGHWRWIAPWGWTWIDNQPWGFATSHYGRWARIEGSDPGMARWAWVPGERATQPVFAPALVAFLGTPGVGLSYPDSGGPAVAWFPLAPGELYWPNYTDDFDAIRQVNAGAVANAAAIEPGPDGAPPLAVVKGEYRNRRAASVVPRAAFVGGKPVAAALIRLPDERLDNAPVLAGSPQIAPPAPRPAVVAAAPAPTGRAGLGAASRFAAARHLAQAHNRGNGLRLAVMVRPANPRAGHWHVAGERLGRSHVVAAARPAHQRIRLAAARHGIVR